jgi:hypothetical protein
MKRQTIDRPAFMLYAANLSVKREWRRMPLAERGLFLTMLMECWINQEIPADIPSLASYLYLDSGEVANLLPGVMWYFSTREGELFCPSLDQYRDEQDKRIERQSAGGKKSAEKMHSHRKTMNSNDSLGGSQVTHKQPMSKLRVAHSSLDQSRPDQNKSNQSPGGDSTNLDPFVADYVNHESDYDKASKGY